MPIIPADQTGAPVDSSPSVQPSPNSRRVGIRIITFETCSGFTRVTARLFAKPPKAAFVTRLQHSQLPVHAARQLPDLSTTIWVDSSSTGDPRRRGAREFLDFSAVFLLVSIVLSFDFKFIIVNSMKLENREFFIKNRE